MNQLFCKVDPFVMQQRIYRMTDDSQVSLATTDIEKLGATLSGLAHSLNIPTVHLCGLNEYLEEVRNDIISYEMQKYGKHDFIEVEVN